MITRMKKLYFFFILLLSLQAQSQQLYKISKNYYRADPFRQEFSSFLNQLMKDPLLINKTIHKKTDSTLFFLDGIYNSYSPFFFKTTHCKVALAEREEAVDSTGQLYSFFLYQLVGYAPAGKDGIKDVQQEFEKFCRQYKRGFTRDNYKELKLQDQQTGEIRDYYYKDLLLSPLTVAWATNKDHTENVFAITIRFSIVENTAYLPIPADGL